MTAAEEALSQACGGRLTSGTGADAVCGVVPRLVASPGSVDEVAAVMRVADEYGLSVVPRGSGSKAHWGAAPRACDLIVDLGRLNRVLDHAAGDMVVEVEAGCGIGDLAEALARAGQRLSVDIPGYDDGTHEPGTVGGLIATSCSGPRRLSFGTIRDLLLGVTMVRTDGVVASSGGRVVKNVAGYDLGKLLTGSFGTLGVITSAILRLHPVPEATAWLTTAAADPSTAAEVVSALIDGQQSPTTIDIARSGDGPIAIAASFEGTPAGAGSRAAASASGIESATVQATGTTVSHVAPMPTAESEGLPVWHGSWPGSPHDTLVSVTVPPASIPEVLDAIAAAGRAAGFEPTIRGGAAVGAVCFALPAEIDPAMVPGLVDEVRERLETRDGTAVIVHSPIREHLDVWGPVDPGALALMRRVKDQFDPGHRLSPGRFVAGI